MTPTPDDLTRDLEADFRFIADVRRHQGPNRSDLDAEFWAIGDCGWPAAIRRALAAEARIARLEADLAAAQAVAEGLAKRVADQSELLTRRAEKGCGG